MKNVRFYIRGENDEKPRVSRLCKGYSVVIGLVCVNLFAVWALKFVPSEHEPYTRIVGVNSSPGRVHAITVKWHCFQLFDEDSPLWGFYFFHYSFLSLISVLTVTPKTSATF